MVKSINLRNNVTECRFILFPTSSSNDLMLQQIDAARRALEAVNMDWDMAYFHNSSHTPKGLLACDFLHYSTRSF